MSGKVSQVICDFGYPFRSDIIFGINENLQRIRLSVETLRNFSVIPLVFNFFCHEKRNRVTIYMDIGKYLFIISFAFHLVNYNC